MAVVNVIGMLEERFGIMLDDDDIDGSSFATIGSVVELVDGKLQA